jgi:hypothetical protein
VREPFSLFEIRQIPIDVASQSTLQLYFHAKNAGEIASTGTLKNLHQRPDVQAYAERVAWRAGIEDNLAGLSLGPSGDPDAPMNALRPKSAVLDLELPETVAYDLSGGMRFGALVAVLKPRVARRATFTPFDSGAMSPSNTYTTPDRLAKEVHPVHTDTALLPGPYSEYFEAQVWGEIGLSDIAEFWVPELWSTREAGDVATAIAELRQTGIPIFSYSESLQGNRYRRVRQRRLD